MNKLYNEQKNIQKSLFFKIVVLKKINLVVILDGRNLNKFFY